MRKLLFILLLLTGAAYGDVQMKTTAVGEFSFEYPTVLELSNTTMGIFLESDFGFNGQISEELVNWSSAEALLKRKGVDKIESFTINEIQIKAGTEKSDFDNSVTRIYMLTKNGNDALYISFKWKEEKQLPAELSKQLKATDLIALADLIVKSAK